MDDEQCSLENVQLVPRDNCRVAWDSITWNLPETSSNIETSSLHGQSMDRSWPVTIDMQLANSNQQPAANNSDQMLLAAVKDGDLNKVQMFLEQGADPSTAVAGLSCSQIATTAGSTEILALLLNHGANINVLDRGGKSLLRLAVDKKRVNCIKLLAEKDLDLNRLDRKRNSPLFAAARDGWAFGLRLLLHLDAKIQTKNGKQQITVLQLAARRKNVAMFKAIIAETLRLDNYKQIINFAGKAKSPLVTAVLAKNVNFVEILLAAQVEVMQVDEENRNVFHYAVQTGNCRIMSLLFDHKKIEPYKTPDEVIRLEHDKWHENMTCLAFSKWKERLPLHVAIARGNLAAVKWFIKRWPEIVDVLGYDNNNVLHMASLSKNDDILAYFSRELRQSTSLQLLANKVNDFGSTPVRLAIFHQQTGYVQALVYAGMSLNAAGASLEIGQCKTFKLLIDKVPSPMSVLTAIFDDAISLREKNGVHILKVNFRVLLTNSDGFSLLDLIVKAGDKVDRKLIFEHTLVDNHIELREKRISGPYITLLNLYVINYFLILLLPFSRYFPQNAVAFSLPNLSLLLFIMSVLLVHEAECIIFFLHRQPPFYWAETVIRIVYFVLSGQYCLTSSTEYLAFATLLATALLILNLSRVTGFGIYMLYVDVSIKYLKMMAMFIIVITGFMMAFMALFRGNSPFDTPLSAVMKIIVMMTNEFEYENLSSITSSTNSNKTLISHFSVMVLIFLFIVFSATTLSNLFVAVAVGEIDKRDKIRKRLEFFRVYERFLLEHRYGSKKNTNGGIIVQFYMVIRYLVRCVKPNLLKVNPTKLIREKFSIRITREQNGNKLNMSRKVPIPRYLIECIFWKALAIQNLKHDQKMKTRNLKKLDLQKKLRERQARQAEVKESKDKIKSIESRLGEINAKVSDVLKELKSRKPVAGKRLSGTL